MYMGTNQYNSNFSKNTPNGSTLEALDITIELPKAHVNLILQEKFNLLESSGCTSLLKQNPPKQL